MAEIKVSQLPEASEINDNDLIMIVQNNVNKKITKENCKFASGDEIAVSDTEPTGEESESVKLWIEPSETISGSGFELNKFYPVGSIYINTTGVNPGTFMGGTWEAFGSGKVLVGQDISDTDFDTLLDTGGEKTHILSKNELPNDRLSVFTSNDTSGSDILKFSSTGVGTMATGSRIGLTEPLGNGVAHNNLQPYIVVSMWLRTA